MRPATTHLGPAPDDPRVLQAAHDYLGELEAGRKPDRQAYLVRHPDLAAALAECFDGIELAHGGALALGPVSPPEPEYPASTLGDFQILREVGRGGMGVVYEAVQLSLGRRVALKVLPFAAALDAKHLQRFKTEAHAAAQLHHTNIVPVYAVGCERGVHFYAMQLIAGRGLDEVIRELRGEDGPSVQAGGSTVDFRAGPTAAVPASARTSQRSGRARESYRTAARIAAQVADALEYAHEAGVVHRDVKPANLLLDAKGNVWVTDFGLALVMADVGLTQTGDVLGTLRYMSPEQAAGQRVLVDHRTDIYSLGATLYELLTLGPIFSGQDRRALLFQILHEEPRPLRQADRSIPAELETIVLKAVAKAPEERYATAGEMAADLRRFLDDQPILARRPSPAERVRKWMRRHPSFVGAALLLLAFSVVGLAATTGLVAREQAETRREFNRAQGQESQTRREYERAQALYAKERQRAAEAAERFRLAQRAADELVRLTEEELAGKPELKNLRRRLLETALIFYQELIASRREGTDAQAELAVTRDRVEKIVADLVVLQGNERLSLLRHPAVREDLRASPEQGECIAELSRRLREQGPAPFWELRQLTQEQRDRRSLEVARDNDVAVKAVLAPEQVRRLRQIALQAGGRDAFQEPDVAAELKLTAAQRERIRSIQVNAPSMPHHCGPGPEGRLEKEKLEQARKSARDKALAVLTKEQAARWKKLTGEPFEGALTLHSPGPPGPARRGAGPQGDPKRPGPQGGPKRPGPPGRPKPTDPR